jgi:hypothetical protein
MPGSCGADRACRGRCTRDDADPSSDRSREASCTGRSRRERDGSSRLGAPSCTGEESSPFAFACGAPLGAPASSRRVSRRDEHASSPSPHDDARPSLHDERAFWPTPRPDASFALQRPRGAFEPFSRRSARAPCGTRELRPARDRYAGSSGASSTETSGSRSASPLPAKALEAAPRGRPPSAYPRAGAQHSTSCVPCLRSCDARTSPCAPFSCFGSPSGAGRVAAARNARDPPKRLAPSTPPGRSRPRASSRPSRFGDSPWASSPSGRSRRPLPVSETRVRMLWSCLSRLRSQTTRVRKASGRRPLTKERA